MTILLVQGCSKSKNRPSSPVPPLELYDGYYFKIINKAMRDGDFDPAIDICVLSAKYGIIRADDPISWYDRQMNERRANELKDDIREELEHIVEGTYHSVIVNVGQAYLAALSDIQQYLSADVQFIEGGGMGVKGHILKRVIRGETEAVSHKATSLA